MKGNLTPAEETFNATSPARRAELIAVFIAAAAFYETHHDVPVPDRFTFSIDVLGDGPDEREYDCLMTALRFGVPAVQHGDGTMHAELRFGPLTFEKHTQRRAA